VVALNAALLKVEFGLEGVVEDLPSGYLVPPVPSRADYVRAVAKLVAVPGAAADRRGAVPRGPQVLGVDIGTGASVIFPLLGRAAYGWSWVATETDDVALTSARQIVERNFGSAQSAIEFVDARPQAPDSERSIFTPAVVAACAARPVAFVMCNPPFYASEFEAAAKALQRRKFYLNKRAIATAEDDAPFGGAAHELWCAGGESAFIETMLHESRAWFLASGGAPIWFTSLISKKKRLTSLEAIARDAVGVAEIRFIEFATNSKLAHVLAWTFLTPPQREARVLRLRCGPADS